MRPADHPAVPPARIGVLLVNLGTPDAPTPKAVRRYLGEFLWDKRVVEIPRLVWWPILNLIILNTRPKKSAHAYGLVWTEAGSPLAAITRAQAEQLQVQLGEGVLVRWAMRYGNPAIADEVKAMKDAGCERILIAPLYPQYSGATTATVIDAVGAALKTMRWQPALPEFVRTRHPSSPAVRPRWPGCHSASPSEPSPPRPAGHAIARPARG